MGDFYQSKLNILMYRNSYHEFYHIIYNKNQELGYIFLYLRDFNITKDQIRRIIQFSPYM